MKTVVKQMGRSVQIGQKIIPAVNIQVDDFPRVIDGVHWLLYFEVMFEDGSLWVVTWDKELIRVEIFPEASADNWDDWIVTNFTDWDEFVRVYTEKIDLITKMIDLGSFSDINWKE